MLQRFRDRFGTAGVVIAVIALVAALGGTALAASGALTGKQKKEVEKIAKKFAGVNGTNGSNGANGSDGKEGSQGKEGPGGKAGADGTDGTNGTSVTNTAIPAGINECEERGGTKFQVGSGPVTRACNGERGETGFTATLPSEASEKGTWALGPAVVEGAATEEVGLSATISFPIPLKEWLERPQVVIFEGETAPTGCTLTVTEEQENKSFEYTPETWELRAEPGYLCIWKRLGSEHFRLDTISPFNVEIAGVGAGKTGAILSATEPAGEFGFGTWAVTAP